MCHQFQTKVKYSYELVANVFEDLEFVGIKKMTISDLALLGIEEINIPLFMRIK
jgi:hypothetical protein